MSLLFKEVELKCVSESSKLQQNGTLLEIVLKHQKKKDVYAHASLCLYDHKHGLEMNQDERKRVSVSAPHDFKPMRLFSDVTEDKSKTQ